VTSATPEGKPTEVGKGIIDIPGVLKALLKVNFSYHLALEYEANGDDPVLGIMESYAFVRGVLSAFD
jgi:sugar phosphate isomerase/epimerase